MIAETDSQLCQPTKSLDGLLRKNVKAVYSVKQSVFKDCFIRGAPNIFGLPTTVRALKSGRSVTQSQPRSNVVLVKTEGNYVTTWIE